MNVGQRFTLAWKHPHRLEATVVALERDYIVCEVDHRCGFACHLKAMKNTLPIEGRMRYTYGDFAKLFLPLNVDAVALPSLTRKLSPRSMWPGEPPDSSTMTTAPFV